MSGGSSDSSATSTLATTEVPPHLQYPPHRGCDTGKVHVHVTLYAKGMQHAGDIVNKDILCSNTPTLEGSAENMGGVKTDSTEKRNS